MAINSNLIMDRLPLKEDSDHHLKLVRGSLLVGLGLAEVVSKEVHELFRLEAVVLRDVVDGHELGELSGGGLPGEDIPEEGGDFLALETAAEVLIEHIKGLIDLRSQFKVGLRHYI